MHEWVHLPVKEKRHYFLSEGAAGILLMFPLLGGVLFMDSTSPRFLGLYFGLACVGALWTGKLINIRVSIRRCPPKYLTSNANLEH